MWTIPILPASDRKTLLNRLTGHFPSGQMAFDAVSQQGAKMAKWRRTIFCPHQHARLCASQDDDLGAVCYKIGGGVLEFGP